MLMPARVIARCGGKASIASVGADAAHPRLSAGLTQGAPIVPGYPGEMKKSDGGRWPCDMLGPNRRFAPAKHRSAVELLNF